VLKAVEETEQLTFAQQGNGRLEISVTGLDLQIHRLAQLVLKVVEEMEQLTFALLANTSQEINVVAQKR